MSATLALRDPAPMPRIDVSRAARLAGALLQAVLVCASMVGVVVLEQHKRRPLPAVVPLDLYATFARTDLVQVTVRAGWTPITAWVPYETVVRDPTLWQRMQFQDWDRLAEATRRAGLTAMIARYGHAVRGTAWEGMTADDWDRVPQPIRAMAFLEMSAYWSRHYRVGLEYGHPVPIVADTVGAIIMVESWFEHRSAVANDDGNIDVGIGQCSDYCRAALIRLARAGSIDFAPATIEVYANPWHAARAAALWFATMLDEADGDLELAIRAYYRGMPAARRGAGTAYLTNVLDKRERFVQNRSGTPAWTLVHEQLRSEPAAGSDAGDAGAAGEKPFDIRERRTVHAGQAGEIELERQHGVLERAPARILEVPQVMPRERAAQVDTIEGAIPDGPDTRHEIDCAASRAPWTAAGLRDSATACGREP